MLEQYLNIITNIENYVDGILVIDHNANITYIRQFRPDLTPLDEKNAIGKNIFEVYPQLDPASSTLSAALHRGETTLNNQEILTTASGETFQIIDNTFPIKEDDKIIGAVSIATFPDKKHSFKGLMLNSNAATPLKDLYTLGDIIGRSPAIQKVRTQINRISQTSSSVLIFGATGTGKEMVAQSIHTCSIRKNQKFFTQNCAAIPATLLESLFFGTTKGSYTGAENREGIFESAQGGTVFLDEINSMDINLQAKILRILEEKKVMRIGSTHSFPVDVRIIAAINQHPSKCIEQGTLRPDLFYRLGGVTIDIPPLSERGDDIELLAEYFISDYNKTMGKNIIGVSQEVMSAFKIYSWPGNIREFKNVIEGAFNLCDNPVISISDLPSYMISSLNMTKLPGTDMSYNKAESWKGSLKESLDAYEKEIIQNALKSHPSRTAAAAYLGITRQALNQKLKKYDLLAKDL